MTASSGEAAQEGLLRSRTSRQSRNNAVFFTDCDTADLPEPVAVESAVSVTVTAPFQVSHGGVVYRSGAVVAEVPGAIAREWRLHGWAQ